MPVQQLPLGAFRRRILASTTAGLLALSASRCTKPHATVPSTDPAAPAAGPGPVAAAPGPAQPAPAAGRPATHQSLAHLTVRIIGLRNQKGQLIFGVFTSADGFPNIESKSVNWQVKDAGAEPVMFEADLPPGVYGASVLHDENRNGQMDRNLAGIPREGYGVTKNPKPALRAATFEESAFTLPPEGRVMTITVQYFE